MIGSDSSSDSQLAQAAPQRARLQTEELGCPTAPLDTPHRRRQHSLDVVALDLFEIREMFELRSAMAFATLPQNSLLWQKLKTLRDEHVSLLKNI